jgi:hypothetical protein
MERSTSAGASGTSLHYESLKDAGTPPIAASTPSNPAPEPATARRALQRSTDDERAQLRTCAPSSGATPALVLCGASRRRRAGGNVFAELRRDEGRKPGQISEALFAVGGRYRRSMHWRGHGFALEDEMSHPSGGAGEAARARRQTCRARSRD